MYHSLLVDRRPLRMALPVSVTFTLLFLAMITSPPLKIAVQLQLQSCPMESRGECRFETLWHSVADVASPGNW